ncbi:MAG: hypothetical protein IPL61_21350 [Myxococcales bacterium]|nr:hypothetical protein [Myxococcales bacterium]
MTALVPAVIAARFALLAAVPRGRRALGLPAEAVFFALCTVVGAVNDWNSVTRHRVYDYRVPVDLPSVSTIPLWMLLYWGLVLRFLATLFRWRRLALPPPAAAHPGARIAVLLALVVITRQAVYRTFADPVWSWLPFALAIAVAVIALRPGRARLLVLAGFVVVGPLVEVLYIQLGHLHAYHLGWLGGVPVWIALWWGLAALVWDDLSRRLQTRLRSAAPGAGRAAGAQAGQPSRLMAR